MIIYLYGPDSYRRQEKLKWYVEQFKTKHSGLSFEKFNFEEAGDLAKLKDFAVAQSLFDKTKLGIIHNAAATDPKKIAPVLKSILDDKSAGKENAQLIICHPPYFNSYKYSGVNSLELSWMGINHADIRKNEVRESFKVGKPEKVSDYVTDMSRGLKNLSSYLKKDGRLALMIGDTVIKGQYIPVTKMLLHDLSDVFELENSALRIPKFTEASWAASQRRKGHQVGINLCDLILILKKK